MKIEARAKINLTLNVTGCRDNGYHDLELIFQPVSLCDTLYIEKKPDQSLAFSCSVKLFENEDNLVCKTYRAMAQRYPQIGGLGAEKRNRSFSRRGCRGLSSHTGQHRARHRGGAYEDRYGFYIFDSCAEAEGILFHGADVPRDR